MDQKIKPQLKWNPYVLMRGDECQDFWKIYYNSDQKTLLYIIGKGFDFRMNFGLTHLLKSSPSIKITCLLIDFDEGKSSSSKRYLPLVEENLTELKKLVGKDNIIEKKIELWSSSDKKKRRVGDKNATELIQDYGFIENYSDIIVDISALPKGIYFSLIGKILSLLHTNVDVSKTKNFFVLTAENAALDKSIVDEEPDDELSYVFGFMGGSELTSDKKPTIWIPILGEGVPNQIVAVHRKIKPEEICPVLPFPSKNPRRSDNLIMEYHQLLFDELNIESQNILYVPEQNPFEVYRTLTRTINNYYQSLNVLNGCDIVISTFSSKLLSIGALLVAFEFKLLNTIKVGILNVDSSGYNIEDELSSKKLLNQSELFIIWLSGEPYSN